MNFKQKLTYMLIGSLFTLAGYFFASLGGSALQDTHAQQNGKQVIDEIVCKQIKVVNSFGKTMAVIKGSTVGGWMTLHNTQGEVITLMRPGIYNIYARPGRDDDVTFDSVGEVEQGEELLHIGPMSININNLDGKNIVSLGASLPGFAGYIDVNNKKGKDLVYIGAQKDRPNDGLINVYNHKGEWRSISKD